MKKLDTIDADTLLGIPYEPVPFLVEDLLPPGLHLLAGAPKIGKSWLALWLCLRVAQGEPLWNFSTRSCEVLYLCLEDSFQRIQSRLLDLLLRSTKLESVAPLKPVVPEIIFMGSSSFIFRRWWINRTAMRCRSARAFRTPMSR